MAVTLYKSSDASAPVLTGVAGSLITVLDGCLVNGYGSKAAAGWTKPFSGSNLAVYRNNPTGGTGFYLNIDDSAPAGNVLGTHAYARGNEVATQANTRAAVTGATGPYPTAAQLANGIPILKGETPDATARPWTVSADDKTFTLLTKPGNMHEWSGFHYGDIFSLKTGDAYRSIILGRGAEEAIGRVTTGQETFSELTALNAAAAAHYMPRSYLGASEVGQVALAVGKHSGDGAKRGLVPYPNLSDESLLLAQVWVHEPIGALGNVRGRLRGLWDFLPSPVSNVNHGDTFSGTGPLAGKTFEVVKPIGRGVVVTAVLTSPMQLAILETSNTWETSS